MQKRFFLFVSLVVCLVACNKEEQIPAYIKLEAFTVNAPGGAAHQKLPHAWVYVDNVFLGGFPVPGGIPVLAEGEKEIEIYPGIRENGSRQTPTLYPLMGAFKQNVQLVAGQTVTVTPIASYFNIVTSPVGGVENFDGASVFPFDDLDGDNSTFLEVGSADGFEGKYGLLKVDTSHVANWVMIRQVMEGLPTNGDRPIFLEMHYKNDTPFEVRLFGSNQTGSDTEVIPLFQFNNSENWNKIYINLTDFIASSKYPQYQIQFRTTLPIDLTTGKYVQTQGNVYFDNIKVLYF